MANGRYKPTTNLLWRIEHQMRLSIDPIQPPDSLIRMLVTLVVGIGTRLGAVVFVWMLRQINQFTLQRKWFLARCQRACWAAHISATSPRLPIAITPWRLAVAAGFEFHDY